MIAITMPFWKKLRLIPLNLSGKLPKKIIKTLITKNIISTDKYSPIMLLIKSLSDLVDRVDLYANSGAIRFINVSSKISLTTLKAATT